MSETHRAPSHDTDRETKRDWKLWLIVTFGTLLIRTLASTWRLRITNDEYYRPLRARRQPFIFAFWHGQMLPLLWVHRNEGVAIVISSHRDGEIIARIGERLGYRSIRGSSSRNATRALIGMVRELEAGAEIAVTPDGPRGPAKKFASGALVAGQRAGAPIMGIGVSASRAWHLRSWDRFMIPKPFSTVRIVYAMPTLVTASSPREAENEAAKFEALIDDAVAEAERA